MAIDLRKNKDALLKAYNDVVADNNKIDWAVFTYEGQTTTLKVAETGEGGISEMVDELNGSKIMYAYCKVMDPNTSLPKYVLISWQGEAAPEAMKFKCANHLPEVTKFFRGIHVTINARTDSDVDEDDILKKVAASSGSQYSIHHEKAKPQEPVAPVGSVYEKTKAAKDINIKERDKFWAKAETEEQKRLEAERRAQFERQQSVETERKQREAQEAEERERQVKERMKKVQEIKIAERRASQSEDHEAKKQWEKEQEQAFREEEARRQEAEQQRRERAAEAEKLATKTSDARSFFKKKESHSEDADVKTQPVPKRVLKHGFASVDQNEPPSRKEPVQLPRKQPSPPPAQAVRQASPPRRGPPPVHREPSPPAKRDPSPPPQQSPATYPATRNLLAQNLPPRQSDSDEDEGNEDDWGEDEEQNTPSAPATHLSEPVEHFQEPEPEEYAPEVTPASGVLKTPEMGMCCIALYDYQASDDTEITFDPDDVITNVEQIDEGWWMGTAPNGSRGMFPANYVEVMGS
ncbi:drebrin-like protein A isoform X2 [Dreissena polymorpha]|uniref:drebrin-like protein A isoform X2 n=1 Tax=Dreissena polymorpha TaxID=45954 RepID=UPI002263B2AE|nr:drebrin-like protein A isoform X2 [Dreissena polymorpha]